MIELPITYDFECYLNNTWNYEETDEKLVYIYKNNTNDLLLKVVDGNEIFRLYSYGYSCDIFHKLKYLVLNEKPFFEAFITIFPCRSAYTDLKKVNLKLNIKLIEDRIYDNMNTDIFKNIIKTKYNFTNNYQRYKSFREYPDVSKKSYIPQNITVSDELKNKIPSKLFNYQLKSIQKMIDIENKTGNNSDLTFSNMKKILVGKTPIYLRQNCTFVKDNKENIVKITTSGGILADEMGLGKTLTTISLIVANTIKDNTFKDYMYETINEIKYLKTNCSLVICPNHLIKQWMLEIKENFPTMKVLSFITKRDHGKISYDDIINTDILLVSQQFLMNFKHYPTIMYKSCTPASFSFMERNNMINNKLKNMIGKGKYKTTFEPLLDAFYFERIIIDEGHEIFGEMATSNRSQSLYLNNIVKSIHAKNHWFVSGTPFTNIQGYVNSLKFIKMKMIKDNITYDITKNDREFRAIENTSELINNFIIKHSKDDIKNDITMAKYKETVIKVQQTEMEKNLYQSYKSRNDRKLLQQLCCHPLIADSINNIIAGNKEVNLDEIQDKLLEHHKKNITIYSSKLEQLNPALQEYHMLKANYSAKLSESKYILSVLEKMAKKDEIEEENCSICFDTLEDPVLTKCGHLFCSDCLEMCMEAKKTCPMCKTNLKGTEIIKINSTNIKKENSDSNNPLINKYGSKLGKLISMIRYLTSNSNNRIIVFSQWDNMLSLLSKTLSENGVGNSVVKGNIWARNSAISKFKKGVNKLGGDNKVIMLSLNNAASGTNLNEATHIFFIEPVDASVEEIRAIEGQAIGRAIRLGKTDDVKIIRIITKNTIEEEIHNSKYTENTFVDTKEMKDVDEYLKNEKKINVEIEV